MTTFIAAVLMTGWPLLASGETVRGELVEIACQKGKGAAGVGASHKECALKCVNDGILLGILAGNVVYEIHGPYSSRKYEKLRPMIAEQVEATGNVAVTKDGKRRVFNVQTIKTVK